MKSKQNMEDWVKNNSQQIPACDVKHYLVMMTPDEADVSVPQYLCKVKWMQVLEAALQHRQLIGQMEYFGSQFLVFHLEEIHSATETKHPFSSIQTES